MARRQRTALVYHYTAVFEPDRRRGYTVTIPTLPGCISEGDTFEEAFQNIREAAALYLSALHQRRCRAPRERRSPFTAAVEVAAA